MPTKLRVGRSEPRTRLRIAALTGLVFAAVVAVGLQAGSGTAGEVAHWVGTWAASPQLTEEGNLPPEPGFVDTTLRQVAHVSLGGRRLRVRFSNAFGDSALTLLSARIARSTGSSTIDATTDQALTFQGRVGVTIPVGALMVSDPLEFELTPLSEVSVTVHVRGAPAEVTGHPGSRTTSYFQTGESVSAPDLPAATLVDHWYFLSGIDVEAPGSATVAILGDSITDGRGSTTNGNDRWPDNLARRLQADEATARVAVVNHGIGGNRLLRDGLGPSALARLDRDILAQPGVRWLIVFEGVNDIGTRAGLEDEKSAAVAPDIIAAYEQIIVRAHTHGIRVYGATLLPFGGHQGYDTPEGEADRQAVNDWIRTSGRFDAVIDFDAITRDPDRPLRLSSAVDGGDHLHPSAAGYRIMADAIDLDLFAEHDPF